MFYIILISIITLSYISYKYKVKECLWLIWFLIYFLFAFEYDTSNDYRGYLSRYYIAIGKSNSNFVLNFALKEKMEAIYKFLMQISEPIGFFGFCLVLSFFNVSVLWKWIKTLIPLKYLWLFFIVFICNPNYCLLLINSKRQALAICFILLGAYILIKYINTNKPFTQQLKSYPSLICLASIIIAGNIHFSAYLGILYYFIILFYPTNLKKYATYCIIAFFFLTFYVNIKDVSFIGFLLEDNEKYTHYIQEIITNNSMTLIYHVLDCILLLLILHFYKLFNKYEKIFSIASIIALICSHILINTASRMMLPYAISIPFVSIFILKYIKNNVFKTIYLLYLLAITMRWFYNTMAIGNRYYDNWNHMKTIFEAPEWL